MCTKKILYSLIGLAALFLYACQPTSIPAGRQTNEAITDTPTITALPVDTSLSATLSELTGIVEMHQPAAAEFGPATEGDLLQVGGQVRTGEDGRARLDLSSGTIVRVSPASLFTLAANEPAADDNGLVTRIQMEFGKIFVILSGGSLDVETPSGLASVRGSYLMVENLPEGGVRITCLEGTCELETAGGKVILSDGEAAEVQNAGQAPVARKMTPEEFQDWLNNNPEAILVVTPTSTPETEGSGQTTGSSGECFGLLAPASGSAFGDQGVVTFSWEEMPGAVQYRLTFNIPGGFSASFNGEKTSHKRYLASLALGGEYSWTVTAFGANGEKICTAGPWSFTKEAYIPTETPIPTRRPPDPNPGCGTACAPPGNCICP